MAGYNMLTKRAPAKSRRDTRLSWNSHIDNNIRNCAEVDFQDRLLMTNNLPLTIRRKYSEIVNFECLYVRYYVDANDFDPLVTRMILISDCITPVGFNSIISI